MSSGISTQGSRGLSATGAVSSVRTCAVLGSSETPLIAMIAGANRTASIATARATRPAGLHAIGPNAVPAMAQVCRAWVAKPNFRRAFCGWGKTWGTEILCITLLGDQVESGDE